jgi:hypothetical protein
MAVEIYQFPERFCTTDVTMASGSVTSGAGGLRGTTFVGVVFPAGMQGVTTSVQGSADGTTYVDAYNKGGTQLQLSTGASRYVYLGPDDEVRIGWVRLVAASTQTASRTITLLSTIR